LIVIDLVEILSHWYAGRPKVEVARSLGVDPKTVRRYVAAAEATGLVPGGPPVSEEQWRGWVREWFPNLVDSKLRQPSWGEIDRHRELIEGWLGVVPASVIHQRLKDEHGLEASVASLRRYLRAHFDEATRQGELTVWRPPVDPGVEAQVDYGYLGIWLDPQTGRRRKVWAFSMVLAYSRHLFVFPVLRMDQQAWVDAHVAAFDFYNSCPRRVVLDNLRAGVIKPDIYDPKINRAYSELASHYGVLVDPARVAHPKDKGLFSHCTSGVVVMGTCSGRAGFTGGSWFVSGLRPVVVPCRWRFCRSPRSTFAVVLGGSARGWGCRSERKRSWRAALVACRGAGLCRCRRPIRFDRGRPGL
jgi:transposase